MVQVAPRPTYVTVYVVPWRQLLLAIPCIVYPVQPIAEVMASALAGPVKRISDLLAFLLLPWGGQLVLAISSVSEAEVAVSVWPSGEVSACRGAVGFRHAALEDKALRVSAIH